MWKQVSPAAMTNYHCMFTLIHSFIKSFIHSAPFWIACGISTRDPWLEVGEQVRIDTYAPPRVSASMCPGLTMFPFAPSSPGGPFLPGGPAAPDGPASPFSPASPLGPFAETEVRGQSSLDSPGVKVSIPELRNLCGLGLSWG